MIMVSKFSKELIFDLIDSPPDDVASCFLEEVSFAILE